MDKKELKHRNKFIERMKSLTYRIAQWNEDGVLMDRRSGFLYRESSESDCLVITAGHDLTSQGSFIETRVAVNQRLLMVNAGSFNVQYDGNKDYAVSKLPLDLIMRECINLGQKVEMDCYQHCFINAARDEDYGFAVINDFNEFVVSGNNYILPSYLCQELGLRLVDQNEHINYFKVEGEFRGDEFYQGASGAPIADREGAICSIVIGREDGTEILKGYRLDNLNVYEDLK